MPVASERRSSNRAPSRGRSSSNGSGGSSEAQATTRGRRESSRARRTAASSRSRKEASARSRAQGASESASGRDKSASTSGASRSGSNHSARDTIVNVGLPVVTATLGVAGGVLLGRMVLQRNRKLLGIPVPGKVAVNGVSGMTQQIGEAGRQLGKLASEVRSVREKVEQIGRVIS
jgi:hypothetical protein